MYALGIFSTIFLMLQLCDVSVEARSKSPTDVHISFTAFMVYTLDRRCTTKLNERNKIKLLNNIIKQQGDMDIAGGCAIKCILEEMGFVSGFTLNEDNIYQQIQNLGADSELASEYVDMFKMCFHNIPSITDTCEIFQNIFNCYHEEITRKGWVPGTIAPQKLKLHETLPNIDSSLKLNTKNIHLFRSQKIASTEINEDFAEEIDRRKSINKISMTELEETLKDIEDYLIQLNNKQNNKKGLIKDVSSLSEEEIYKPNHSLDAYQITVLPKTNRSNSYAPIVFFVKRKRKKHANNYYEKEE